MAPVLSIDELTVTFSLPNRRIAAVRQVSLAVAARECVAIVGESGSGKTQVFMAAMGLLADNAAAAGSVRFEGGEILGAGPGQLNAIRGSKLTMIFQDPMTSLTPHLKIGTQLAEVLVCHAGASWSEARLAARRMLERVRVPEPERRLSQYPHELSGGLRQRVMIGMGLLCRPQLVIADEPTTALDVTIQAQILDLLATLKTKGNMGLIFITHNLAVVSEVADRVCVMYAGEIVEEGPVAEVFAEPRHPYTAALMASAPEGDGAQLSAIPGSVPQPQALPAGCTFAPRCTRAVDNCRSTKPAFVETGPGRASRCLRWREVA